MFQDITLLIWGVFFSIIGWGFFSYGRKQHAIIPLSSGIGLFVFPYFVSNVYWLVSIGVALILIPFFIKI